MVQSNQNVLHVSLNRIAMASLLVALIGIGAFALFLAIDEAGDEARVTTGTIEHVERNEIGSSPNVHLRVELPDGRHVSLVTHARREFKAGDRIRLTEHHDLIGRTTFVVRE